MGADGGEVTTSRRVAGRTNRIDSYREPALGWWRAPIRESASTWSAFLADLTSFLPQVSCAAGWRSASCAAGWRSASCAAGGPRCIARRGGARCLARRGGARRIARGGGVGVVRGGVPLGGLRGGVALGVLRGGAALGVLRGGVVLGVLRGGVALGEPLCGRWMPRRRYPPPFVGITASSISRCLVSLPELFVSSASLPCRALRQHSRSRRRRVSSRRIRLIRLAGQHGIDGVHKSERQLHCAVQRSLVDELRRVIGGVRARYQSSWVEQAQRDSRQRAHTGLERGRGAATS